LPAQTLAQLSRRKFLGAAITAVAGAAGFAETFMDLTHTLTPLAVEGGRNEETV
jgi:hypothetical protein